MSISQLQSVVEASELSAQDKDVWLHALEALDDDQAQAIVDAIADDPTELETLTRNIKLKQVALASGDTALLDQLLAEEAEEITNL